MYELAGELESRVVKLHVPDAGHDARRPGGGHQLGALVWSEGERLLDQDVLAGVQHGEGDPGVVVGADHDGLHTWVSHQVGSRCVARLHTEAFRDGIHRARGEIADRRDAGFGQLRKERQVHQLSNLAAADNADPDRAAAAHRSSAPPSMTMVVPVTYRASSPQSQQMAAAMSRGSSRWMGSGRARVSPTPGAVACQVSAAGFSVIGVAVPPGCTVLTRIELGASSRARLFIRPTSPALAAE